MHVKCQLLLTWQSNLGVYLKLALQTALSSTYTFVLIIIAVCLFYHEHSFTTFSFDNFPIAFLLLPA